MTSSRFPKTYNDIRPVFTEHQTYKSSLLTINTIPWESGGEVAGAAVVVLHTTSIPAQVVCRRWEGTGGLCFTSAMATRQSIHPGEELLLKPLQQLQQEHILLSKTTIYMEKQSSQISKSNSFLRQKLLHSVEFI